MRWQCECGEYEEETEPRGLEESDLLGNSPNEQLIESLRTQLAQAQSELKGNAEIARVLKVKAESKAQAEKAELVRQCAEIVFNHAETVNLRTGERTLTKRTLGDLNGIAYGNAILSLLPKDE